MVNTFGPCGPRHSTTMPIRYLGTPDQLKRYNLLICNEVTPELWAGRAIPGLLTPMMSARRPLPPLSLDHVLSSKPRQPYIIDLYLDCASVPHGAGVEGVDYSVVHEEGCSHSYPKT
jgi:hypothetical protein